MTILLVLWQPRDAFAQRDIRASIDSERGNDSFTDKKVFDKGRSFIFRDSTYYLGHFFLGGYFFFRANDKLGFNKAITPLRKALELIEKDYDRQLRTRTNSFVEYNAVYRYHSDYGFISYLLEQCYQNVEMPDKAMAVLRHVRDRNFQVEQGVDSYNTMAWIYHRNRVYTSRQFSFLKNSVKENVAMANKLLDSALWKIGEDVPMNAGLFDASFLNHQYLSTYHYKAMMMDYKLEIDSANMYYNELIRYGRYSSNNYAEFKLAMAELADADEYFKEAEQREYGGEKRTKEYYYMRGTLDIYRGHPEMADTLLRKVLGEQGATPGFGWHCIGLARAQHYEGLTDESQNRANKASRFQELHIGTTWGEEQYHLSVASLNYINQLQLKKEYMFENDQWWFWFNPVSWYEWIRYSLEIHQQKLVLASLVAENPERNQVLYSIFSSENLISFDEVWSVIDGIGNEYFIDVYKKMLETDKRPELKKYFRYFLGKLYLAEGDNDQAIKYFQSVLNGEAEPNDYQTLLYARVAEGMAMATSGSKRAEWIMKLYELYPQLVPFSDLTMRFRLETSGQTDSDAASEILDDLKDCNLEFTTSPEAPAVSLHFSPTPEGIEVNYTVQTVAGRMVNEGTLRLTGDEVNDGGKIIAYKLFGINKDKVGEKPAAVKAPV